MTPLVDNRDKNNTEQSKRHEIAPINVIVKETPDSELSYAKLRAALKEPDANKATLKSPPIVYKIKNDVMSIRAANLDDYRYILHKLDEKKFEYYLFREENRVAQLRFVIRGLPGSISPEEIKSDLSEFGLDVDNVTQLKSGRDKSLLPLYLLTIKEVDIGKLREISSIAYIKVRFEDYVPPKGVKQCFKFQRFNHTAKHCHAAARCFKCGQEHESKNCPVDKYLMHAKSLTIIQKIGKKR